MIGGSAVAIAAIGNGRDLFRPAARQARRDGEGRRDPARPLADGSSMVQHRRASNWISIVEKAWRVALLNGRRTDVVDPARPHHHAGGGRRDGPRCWHARFLRCSAKTRSRRWWPRALSREGAGADHAGRPALPVTNRQRNPACRPSGWTRRLRTRRPIRHDGLLLGEAAAQFRRHSDATSNWATPGCAARLGTYWFNNALGFARDAT